MPYYIEFEQYEEPVGFDASNDVVALGIAATIAEVSRDENGSPVLEQFLEVGATLVRRDSEIIFPQVRS